MNHRPRAIALLLVLALLACSGLHAAAAEPQVTDIGDRLELFVDRHTIDGLDGVRLKLHPPRRMETAITFDKPWEGPTCAYVTVFRDGEISRMYYRGSGDAQAELTCYAESKDGIRWTRPNLGLFEWDGSKENNIVWKKGFGSHNFTPFKDARPDVPKDERYKALGRAPKGTKGLVAFASADGIHWRLLSDEPVLTKGAFDSQNLAFWDPNRGSYVAYFRIFADGVRAIAYATSEDFVHWSETKPIELGRGGTKAGAKTGAARPDSLREHFYTNATTLYFRAPHYYFAFPKRFNPSRQKLPDHPVRGISDAVFLSSRDGARFDRTFLEALIRPGRDEHNWGDRSTMVAWGLLQTAPDEMSLYFSQGYRFPTHELRRGVFRLDGIASVHAGYKPGELITKPVRFTGKKLVLNYATSAAGSVRVEIQDAAGKPIPGYALADAKELYGDATAEAYEWKSGSDVSKLAGRPVRLRFALKDCDVYSYRFAE